MDFLDHPSVGTRVSSTSALVRPDDLVGALGRFLTRVHDRPGDVDAVVAGRREYLADARRRVDAGLVLPEHLDAAYRPHAPARLAHIAEGLADLLDESADPSASALVPIHGSLSVADLEVTDGEIVGWAVPEVFRVGDPYVDIVFLARDLATLIGPGAVPALFDATGIERPDPVRIEFWVTLKQLLP